MQFTTNYLESKWHQIKGEVKQKWGKFTDSDLQQMEGIEEKMIGKIQEYYSLSYEEAKKDLENFRDEHFKSNSNS